MKELLDIMAAMNGAKDNPKMLRTILSSILYIHTMKEAKRIGDAPPLSEEFDDIIFSVDLFIERLNVKKTNPIK